MMESSRPLADQLRPQRLSAYIGQRHLLGEGGLLSAVVEQGKLFSMLLWGPPGSGKTSLARLLAEHCDYEFAALSAVLSGLKDVREAVATAEARAQLNQRATVLFIDEVHRFNKAQQDAFLPHVERGTVTLIGATTENPAFEVNSALLSRARVLVLEPLTQDDLGQIIDRGAGHLERELDEDARSMLIALADGDARRLLNLLEIAAQLEEPPAITAKSVERASGESVRRFDKGGDVFYDQISALHKSVRGSAPDAALYWLTRMLDGGADPLYVARRLVRIASEDVGNADPRALQLCIAAWDTYQRLGSPEGELALAQAVLYLASVPKSNAVYTAFAAAQSFVKSQPSHAVPLRLRNAPTGLAKELGHGDGYRYAHDEAHQFAAGERYGPDDVSLPSFYEPIEQGLEQKIRARLARLRELDGNASESPR